MIYTDRLEDYIRDCHTYVDFGRMRQSVYIVTDEVFSYIRDIESEISDLENRIEDLEIVERDHRGEC